MRAEVLKMIYNRSQNVAEVVSETKEKLSDIKSVQIVGNDNLYVHHYENTLSNQFVSGTAIFRADFTFNEPSDSLVLFTVYWTTLDSFDYEQVVYDDPSTINDSLSRSFFFEIAIALDSGVLNPVTAIVDSTTPGLLSFTRVS